ncbi:hypothetical protein SAMN05192561_101894 [Halopenitus malekzadehii]|uniref:Uncharacterized protein n=1 Tax=Halopenitus malekzadehii TaxID=1267564 RepID=A0A1H6I4B0_9EURY|nr:hypothetical protein [Halopenitus malekzadehii]SEH42363.1 hypothetical protein SAMN05192561_101894 [Halopenitus malekzadehii]
MSEGATGSDVGLGVGLAAAAIVAIGAVVMFAGPSQIVTAGGFGVAMIAAILSVSAFHLFE